MSNKRFITHYDVDATDVRIRMKLINILSFLIYTAASTHGCPHKELLLLENILINSCVMKCLCSTDIDSSSPAYLYVWKIHF